LLSPFLPGALALYIVFALALLLDLVFLFLFPASRFSILLARRLFPNVHLLSLDFLALAFRRILYPLALALKLNLTFTPLTLSPLVLSFVLSFLLLQL
jgi:hypothetical protein